MTTFQVISFALLWIVIAAEGALLLLLYQHVARLYAPKSGGLALGALAPALLVRDERGKPVGLSDLLRANYSIFVFGSPTCSGCHDLLNDAGVRRLLSTHPMPSYFFTDGSVSDLRDSLDSGTTLEIFTAERQAFTDYDISSMPFAYVIDKASTIVARGSVGGGLRALTALLDQIPRIDSDAESSRVQVSPASQAGR